MSVTGDRQMTDDTKKQVAIFIVFLLIYAILALIYYLVVPFQSIQLPGVETRTPDVPKWVLGLANMVVILVVYGVAGLAGLWFARQLDLPGTIRPDSGWKSQLVWPLLTGLVVGVFIVLMDRWFAPAIQSALGQDWQGFAHPQFPVSLIASATAGIGEEILFRSFVLGLWAYLLNLFLHRWQATRLALWIANGIAALAFAASHLGTAMLLLGAASPSELPVPVLAELLLLNGVLGLVAGGLYFRDGLVAAIGVHFWADIVWHTLYPLLP